MDYGNEQRVAIKFCFKAGVSATETPVLVQKAYGDEALNRSNVFRWHSRFRDGRELIADDERSCRPKSTRTEVNIAAIAADLVENDRRIAARKKSESLNIPKTVVLRIRREDFCCRYFFLLHNNAPAHKTASVCQFLTPQNFTTLYLLPVLSRFISAILFSVPQVENEVKRTPLCGCC
jgi:hypothetical protein